MPCVLPDLGDPIDLNTPLSLLHLSFKTESLSYRTVLLFLIASFMSSMRTRL